MITLADLRSPIYNEGLDKPRDLNDALGFDLFFSEEYKKKFVVYLHEFVMCMLELPKVKTRMILGEDSILDLSSASDEALALLFYVNNHENGQKNIKTRIIQTTQEINAQEGCSVTLEGRDDFVWVGQMTG